MTGRFYKMLRSLALITAAYTIPGHAQSLSDDLQSGAGPAGGPRLYGVSLYSGYSTLAYPASLGALPTSELAKIGADTNYGASATVGWRRHRRKTDLLLMYTLSYNGLVRYSNVNAFGHVLNLGITRSLGRKWSLSVSGAGADLTMSQFLFQPALISTLAQLPGTFDDLAAAVMAGQFNNAQIASMLTGAPVMQSPAQSILFGNRILNYSAQVALTYAATRRLNLNFTSSSGASETRVVNDAAVHQNYLTPRSIGSSAGMGLSYDMSPRTSIGLNLTEVRQSSRYQTSYTSTATSSVSRKMGPHWFLRLYGGGSYTKMTQQLYGIPPERQVVGGGSLGFRTYRHTFIGSYDRSTADTYGFAAGTTTNVSGSWDWHRRGSNWDLIASFGQQQVRNTGFVSISGWQASMSATKSLGERASLTAQYVYMQSSGTYIGRTANLTVQSVRLSFGWVPQPVMR